MRVADLHHLVKGGWRAKKDFYLKDEVKNMVSIMVRVSKGEDVKGDACTK